MFDHKNYDYITMHLPNVMAEVRKGRVVTTGEIGVSKNIEPLLDALLKKFPNWKFVGDMPYASQHNATTPQTFRMYESGEDLGSISFSHHYKHGGQYVVRNKRIANQRQRGWETRTKDLKKAVRLVVDNFGAKTMHELVEESRNVVSSAMSAAMERPRRNFSRDWSEIEAFAKQYIATHWEEFKPKIAASGSGIQVDDFKATYVAYQEVSQLSEAFRLDGLIVTIKDASYALRRGNNDAVIVTSATLPNDVKTKLGMLKLLDDGEFVPGVGIKANDSTYFVMD
jgi:hypothetical protein